MKMLFILAGAVIACGQQQQPPPAPDPVVLMVGNERITKSEFEGILATLPERQRPDAQNPAAKRKIAEQLAEIKALAHEARERKLDQTPRIQTQIALQTDQILANTLYQDMSSVKPSDATLLAYYDAHKQEWEEVKARHILIRMQGSRVPLKPNQKDITDAEALAKANEVRAKIVAGTDFAAVAKAESDDAGTGANGGELGSFTRGRMVPEFEKAAFSLPIGELSEPVKSPFGYHLIQVESHKTKPFEEVRADVEQKIKPEIAKQGLEAVKKKTPMTFDESYFGK